MADYPISKEAVQKMLIDLRSSLGNERYISIGLTMALHQLDGFPQMDAVPVIRCKECKNGAPLPEEARDEFSPGVMRCLAGRGDCDKYFTTWEDGFCDEGAKMDAKDMDVPTKDGGAE